MLILLGRYALSGRCHLFDVGEPSTLAEDCQPRATPGIVATPRHFDARR
jgi:hypothetical protein